MAKYRDEVVRQLLDENDAEIGGLLRSSRRRIRITYVLVGLLGGIIVIAAKLAATAPSTHTIIDVLWELAVHVAVGFIVAALAVVAYEWGSEVKAALLLSNKLQLIMGVGAESAIERGAHTLLKTDADRFQGLPTTIGMVAGLRHHQSWARPAYIRFLAAASTALHAMSASISTLTLDALELPPSFPLKSLLTLLRPDELIDELLAGLMNELREGDEYYAVSNARIWQRLTRFHASQADAIGRGVKIRRVFVLFDESDEILTPGETVAIIYDHFREAANLIPTNGYEIRIVSRREYHALAPLLEHQLHFGVFRPREGDSVGLDALKPDLSLIELSSAVPQEHYDTFDVMWQSLRDYDDPELRFVLRAERLRHMPEGGRYRAISHISHWSQPQLQRFHDETLARLRATAITVERIFVCDDITPPDALARFLINHLSSIPTEMKGKYRCQFHANSADSPVIPTTVADCMPFGTFAETPDGSDQAMSELYSQSSPLLFTRLDSDVINSAFDSLWQQLRSGVELARRLPESSVSEVLAVAGNHIPHLYNDAPRA